MKKTDAGNPPSFKERAANLFRWGKRQLKEAIVVGACGVVALNAGGIAYQKIRGEQEVATQIYRNGQQVKHPKRLAILTPGFDTPSPLSHRLGLKMAFKGAQVEIGAKYQNPDEIIKKIVESSQDKTLDQLLVIAHGDSGVIYVDGQKGIEIRDFLKSIQDAQDKCGHKIAHSIVFLSCNVFTNLSRSQSKDYMRAAKALDADIVGATSFYTAGPLQTGRFVKITPNGDVLPDQLDMKKDVFARVAESLSKRINRTTDWIQTAQWRKEVEANYNKNIAARSGHKLDLD